MLNFISSEIGGIVPTKAVTEGGVFLLAAKPAGQWITFGLLHFLKYWHIEARETCAHR